LGLAIAMISDHASPLAALGDVDAGGQNLYVAQVASRLAALGHRVDVFTRRDSATLPDVVATDSGYRVFHVRAGPARFVPKEELLTHMDEFTASLVRLMGRGARDYDLVHANFWMSGLAALGVEDTLGVPFVVTFHALGKVRREHQGAADGFSDVRFDAEEEIARRAACVIAECPQDRADMLRHLRADARRIRVVPCGFDPGEMWPEPRESARRSLGVADDAFVVLQLGRLVPRKGIDTAIQGFARMADERSRMFVVGGPDEEPDESRCPELARLASIARAAGVADRVTFTGRRARHDLRRYYSASDVFVTTPWYEPFGITPVEAMACATPVIGAAVGGIKDTVVHGATGWLVPPKDADAVGERLDGLRADPGLRLRFSLAALRRARTRYTWSHVADGLVAAYRDALARRPLVIPVTTRGVLHP
jgi:D-inositol-3-phosphate glycosyltransferase